jgi:hypothetical protein
MIGCQGARHYRPSHGTDKIQTRTGTSISVAWKRRNRKKNARKRKR